MRFHCISSVGTTSIAVDAGCSSIGVAESTASTLVVGGILSLIVILIIGVSALGFIILIIQIRNLKSQLVKQ